jgi:hypothetical protein
MNTIYNVYVYVKSQPQCDRLKQLCIDYDLPYDKDYLSFEFLSYGELKSDDFFCFWDNYNDTFFVRSTGKAPKGKTKVTEQEFIELLNNTKNEN